MFAERFDALMNIAEVSNSQLGRNVHINPSHIGRLRSGARPLPKKHEYLPDMCRYLTGHIHKAYQINALQKLTGIGSRVLLSEDETAQFLECWLLEEDQDTSEVTGRFISGFSRIASKPSVHLINQEPLEAPQKYAPYLYGNAGKRKAVEQFFYMLLQEEKPQTLLLFSDENMAWLYEDSAFVEKWMELFIKVILKGNKVRIIHTISRHMNEMLEAVTKWVPIYLTGMIEPYYYPRLRDGIFQRTLFIAPNTAAIISSSVQQETMGMMNHFLTDRAALDALTVEFEHFFSLCRPLMRIYTMEDLHAFQNIAEGLFQEEGNAYFCSCLPPFFTMPEAIFQELSEQNDQKDLMKRWESSLEIYKNCIKKQHLTLVLLDPSCATLTSDVLRLSMGPLFSFLDLSYTKEQYERHIEWLLEMEKQDDYFKVCFVHSLPDNTVLYIKEDTGVIMAKSTSPQTAFVIRESNMVNAFWDYMEKTIINKMPSGSD